MKVNSLSYLLFSTDTAQLKLDKRFGGMGSGDWEVLNGFFPKRSHANESRVARTLLQRNNDATAGR